MRVRATSTGYHNGLHIPGTDSEEFEVSDGETATWFEPVGKKGKKTAEPPASADGAGEGLV